MSFQAVDGKFSELVSCKASSLEGSEVGELTAEPESELRLCGGLGPVSGKQLFIFLQNTCSLNGTKNGLLDFRMQKKCNRNAGMTSIFKYVLVFVLILLLS